MTTDLNDRIALAQGWTLDEELYICSADRGYAPSHWRDPKGIPVPRPDFTGTLEGVTGMLRELNEHELTRGENCNWVWGFDQYQNVCYVQRHSQCEGWSIAFASPPDRPGDCVGEAWLSVFGKEA